MWLWPRTVDYSLFNGQKVLICRSVAANHRLILICFYSSFVRRGTVDTPCKSFFKTDVIPHMVKFSVKWSFMERVSTFRGKIFNFKFSLTQTSESHVQSEVQIIFETCKPKWVHYQQVLADFFFPSKHDLRLEILFISEGIRLRNFIPST